MFMHWGFLHHFCCHSMKLITQDSFALTMWQIKSYMDVIAESVITYFHVAPNLPSCLFNTYICIFSAIIAAAGSWDFSSFLVLLLRKCAVDMCVTHPYLNAENASFTRLSFKCRQTGYESAPKANFQKVSLFELRDRNYVINFL